MPLQEFPLGVTEKIGYYVYLLIDPETQQVFYIGKGVGNRVFAHAHAAINDETPGEKLDKIRSLLARGFEIKYVVHRHGLTEKEAFEVEAALLDYVGLESLTNQVTGWNSDDRGRMDIGDIISKYAAREIHISQPSILITLNRLYRHGMSDEELYEITRKSWVIGERRNKAQYAFAIYNGIVRQIYAIEKWTPIVTENLEQKRRNRWYFDGKIAYELQDAYLYGSVAKYSTLGAQNPIRYVEC